jgi:hypothetical protein
VKRKEPPTPLWPRYEAVLKKHLDQVREVAYRDLLKVATDGLPTGLIRAAMWGSSDHTRTPADAERGAAVVLARQIGDEAFNAIIELFLDAEFRATLTHDMKRAQTRKMTEAKAALQRKDAFDDAFERVLAVMPTKLSTKALAAKMEKEGAIEMREGRWFLADPTKQPSEWSSIARSTLESKVSRARKRGSK